MSILKQALGLLFRWAAAAAVSMFHDAMPAGVVLKLSKLADDEISEMLKVKSTCDICDLYELWHA